MFSFIIKIVSLLEDLMEHVLKVVFFQPSWHSLLITPSAHLRCSSPVKCSTQTVNMITKLFIKKCMCKVQYFLIVYSDGRVCISILHAPGDDPLGYESSAERWSPVQSVEKILLSVISMLAGLISSLWNFEHIHWIPNLNFFNSRTQRRKRSKYWCRQNVAWKSWRIWSYCDAYCPEIFEHPFITSSWIIKSEQVKWMRGFVDINCIVNLLVRHRRRSKGKIILNSFIIITIKFFNSSWANISFSTYRKNCKNCSRIACLID